MKYRYTRKEIEENYNKGCYDPNFPTRSLLVDLLATKKTKKAKNSGGVKSGKKKEECLHEHLCCPGDIKTVRCVYCGKSMYKEPKDIKPTPVSGIEGLNLKWRTWGASRNDIENKINEIIRRLNNNEG